MATNTRPSLKDCLAREYPFNVIADPDGGYVIEFPDLPGCMTQVEELDEVGPMAAEIQQLWIETAYNEGMDIRPPSYPEEYSGRFVLRLPRSLHRRLAEGAERERVSLNQWVVSILARGEAESRTGWQPVTLPALERGAQPYPRQTAREARRVQVKSGSSTQGAAPPRSGAAGGRRRAASKR